MQLTKSEKQSSSWGANKEISLLLLVIVEATKEHFHIFGEIKILKVRVLRMG
jgi:hypothetical protein